MVFLFQNEAGSFRFIDEFRTSMAVPLALKKWVTHNPVIHFPLTGKIVPISGVIFYMRGQTVPGPDKIDHISGKIMPGPDKIILMSGKIIPASGGIFHMSGKIVPRPDKIIPVSEKTIPIAGKIIPMTDAAVIAEPGRHIKNGKRLKSGGLPSKRTDDIINNYFSSFIQKKEDSPSASFTH